MTQPERLPLTSLDITEDRKAQLRQTFPDVFREDKIDFDALKRALGEWVTPDKERFGLNWPGKAECSKLIQQASVGTLLPMREQSVDFDSTENLIIEGDNLEVLKLLQKSYYGKVKMIYIDPPYNTGNDFIYPDNFHEGLIDYLRYSGQTDADGLKLSTNTESDGRFHSKWLSMMYPRLFLAKNLLHNEGIIAVQIGDTELVHCRKILDEIFGDENYINTISVKTKVAAGASGGGEDKRLKKSIEFVLLYAKNMEEINGFANCFTEEPLMRIIEDMKDAGQSWKYTSVILDYGSKKHIATTKDGEGNPIDIFLHDGIKRSTIAEICRSEQITEDQAYRKYIKGIFSDTNAQTSIRTRVIDAVGSLESGQMYSVEYVPGSGRDKGKKVTHYYVSNTVRRVIWLADIAYASSTGEVIKKERMGTFWDDIKYNNVGKEGGVAFPNGKKPVDLILRLIDLVEDKDALILDFFGGSGTTGHAVLRKNANDGGRRRFILVQLPEKNDEVIDFDSIAELCRTRITNVCNEIAPVESLLSNDRPGFRAYKLSSSNFKVWDGTNEQITDVNKTLELFADHVLDGRSAEDMLYELLLKTGFALTTPVTSLMLADKQVFSAADGALLICLERELSLEVIEAMVALDPFMILCLDAGFSGKDELKVNAMQTVRAHNRNRHSNISLKVV